MIKITCEELIKLTKEDLKGKVIVFPTDTVYGIGALINDPLSIKKIYSLKHRDLNKPLAILAGKIDQIIPFIKINNERTSELMSYWPGALTLVFEKNPQNFHLDQHLKTVGFRIPNSAVAIKILNRFGIMAVTSMNISGSDPLNDLPSIIKEFQDEIDYLVIDQEVLSKTSSTVLDISTKDVKILRKGELLERLDV